MNYEEIHTNKGKSGECVTVLYEDGTYLVHNNRGMPLTKGKYERSILNKNIFIIKYIETEKNNSSFAYYDLDKGVFIANSICEVSENYSTGTVEIKKVL
jgi:hypothetical protein